VPSVEFNGVVHEFPDDFSDADIAAALSQVSPAASHEPQAETPVQPVNVGGRGTGLDLRKSQRRSADALPIIGSGIGAAVGALTSPVTGPVGPAVGAGIGGAGGTALRSLAKGEGVDGGEVLESGITNAGIQAAGPAVGLLGKGLYKGGAALLPKGIKQQYPNIGTTGFKEGIALTRRGAAKADDAIASSSNKAKDMIAVGHQQGAPPIQPMEVLREMRPVGKKLALRAEAGRANEMPVLMDRAKKLIAGGPIPTPKGNAMKGELQDLSTAAYRAQDRGAVINGTEALMDKKQAQGLRLALERRTPGLGDVNARTQDLMGVRAGAEHAADTGHVLSRLGGAMAFGGMAGPAGALPAVAAAGAGATMTTPGGLTAAGLALKGAGKVLPDALRAALLLELLTRDEQEQ
jgi:hypothetical protein